MKNEIVGIDISKDKADLYFLHEEKHRVVEKQDFDRVAAEIKKLDVKLVAIEATGGYERPLVAALADAGVPIAIVNPGQVRKYAGAIGILAKTDKIDSCVIARFAEATNVSPKAVPDEKTREMQEIVTRRRQLIDMITAETNRQKQARSKSARKSIKVVLKTLQKQLDSVDDNLDRMVRESPEMTAKTEIVESVPGVGEVTSRTLMAELPELGDLSRQEIASLVGLAPHNRDSGKFRGKRRICGGRAQIRRVLYMATLTAIKRNSIIKNFYDRLKINGKCFKVAMVACMRKLLVILNSMVKKNIRFCQNITNYA